MLALRFAVAHRRERVGGFTRLRDDDRQSLGRERCFAIAEFRCDIDLGRKPRDALEPVFCRQSRIGCSAARRDGEAVELGEIEGKIFGKPDRPLAEINKLGERMPYTSGCSAISLAMKWR
jgi:hypothetical protein